MGIGMILDDRYELIAELGRGGTSVVYLAKDIKLGRCLAVKCINHQQNNAFDHALENEINILSSVRHQSIPQIIQHIETQSHIYLIMEYINGISLDKKIEVEGQQKEMNIVNWGIGLCDILSYLHTSKETPIIYCDLKPQNIILVNNSPKLIDFGSAKMCHPDQPKDAQTIGTNGYAAPEQYKNGSNILNPCTDLYSLGATLYKAATGMKLKEPKVAHKKIRALNPNISKALEDIIEKCVNFEPGDRYQTTQQLKNDLIEIKRVKHQKNIKLSQKLGLIAASTFLTIFFSTISIVGYTSMDNTAYSKYQHNNTVEQSDTQDNTEQVPQAEVIAF